MATLTDDLVDLNELSLAATAQLDAVAERINDMIRRAARKRFERVARALSARLQDHEERISALEAGP